MGFGVFLFLSENSPRCVSSPAYAGGWEACPQWLTADSLCVKSYRRWTIGLESGARLPFVCSPRSEYFLLPASRHRGVGVAYSLQTGL